MGKDLRGKELGKGLSQRKDSRFSARYRSKTGKRIEKYFDSLPQARNWLDKAKHEDTNLNVMAPFGVAAEGILKKNAYIMSLSDMTVDQWFDFWVDNIITDRSYNTKRNYRERYRFNIQPVIGNLKVADVLPMHCQMIFNNMKNDSRYVDSTIYQTYITLGTLLKAARINRIITVHPMDGLKVSRPPKKKNNNFLTVEEEKKFFEQAKRSHNIDQYEFLIDMGCRTSEMIGLCWDSIDFDMGTININKCLQYRYDHGIWEAGSPKTKAGYRTIPMTERVYKILRRLYEGRATRYESDDLNQVLSFKDRLTGNVRYLDMKDLVFVNYRTGMPTKNSSYDTHICKLCDEAGIRHFGLHTFRHTYATRLMESGARVEVVQELLGHDHCSTTSDTYVGVSDESKREAVRMLEEKNSAQSA
ncbi:MAG: site-specific integrase [Butyrivibrio sp.]|nr:site-specific integrase [Butyrivibrio sp.]